MSWAADFWNRLTAGFARADGLDAQPWLLVFVTAAAVILSVPAPTWRWFGMFVTFVHELGHAFAALTAGHRITGIELRFDHSGQMRSLGRTRFGAVWAGFWGYPVPALTGLALIWAAVAGWAPAALSLGVLVLAAALVFIRNVQGAAIALGCAGVAVLLLWCVPADGTASVTASLGIALLVGAVRDWLNLLSVHTRRRTALESSDAWILAQRSKVPSAVWLLLFAAVIAACAAAAVWLLVPGLLN
ncbi:M50 family metallopeptidase [Arthrobacter gandavensis]|uniref:M50 family metallopeptidase n=1 Tax=Arthrobacter gandavensis TaxID=169960 RepID=UPI00188E3970|nr:M50 family metallopeptidase [Arthrobacter gandavensis]MBF4995441.1 M50 family metallopeptidase [Arthrobacter gandavensis]